MGQPTRPCYEGGDVVRLTRPNGNKCRLIDIISKMVFFNCNIRYYSDIAEFKKSAFFTSIPGRRKEWEGL
jgi:hypothetical protein